MFSMLSDSMLSDWYLFWSELQQEARKFFQDVYFSNSCESLSFCLHSAVFIKKYSFFFVIESDYFKLIEVTMLSVNVFHKKVKRQEPDMLCVEW